MMVLKSGLLNGQVLQRDKQNKARASVAGLNALSGSVEVRVVDEKTRKCVFDWKKAGHAAAGRWSARLEGLPVGGPYRIKFRTRAVDAQESCEIRDVYVGDVWFLAGQSNMQGLGNLEDAAAPDPMVRCFYMRDEWDIAREPLHFLAEAIDEAHLRKSFSGKRPSDAEIADLRRMQIKGVGPGLHFAKAILKKTDVPQGIVACAHGGTSMAEWAPALKKKRGASFYGAMLRRFKKLGQPIAGIIWYQGCADTNSACAAIYTKRMKKLIKASRRDFGQARLPWAIVQIGRVMSRDANGERFWNAIQEQQRKLPEAVANVDVVPSVDLDLDDGIHISGADHARLGARLAQIMARIALGDHKTQPAITLKSIRFGSNLKTATGRVYNGIEVAFANVVGGLRASDRAHGFMLSDEAGNPVTPGIFKVSLAKNRAFLECDTPVYSLQNLSLHYGFGANPYVNIVDSRDMALPVFGPVPISRGKPMRYLLDWEVAQLEVVAGGLAKVTPERPGSRLCWKRPPKLPVPNLPCMIMPAPVGEKRHGLFLFRTSARAMRPARVKLAIGSDSGIRIWLNNSEVYRNLNAINPMYPDQYNKEVLLQKGTNRLLVGFDARGGQGWGFSLRFVPLRPNKALPAGIS